jgi:predicted TIM-barrel fold metal-dependent hydrolase
MKIIDAHLHCFNGKIPDFSNYGNHELVAGVIMDTGYAEMLSLVPERAVFCRGLKSGTVTPENTPSLLADFDKALSGPRCVGIKLYCGYESVYPADSRHFPFLDILMKHGKTLVIHSGENAGGHGLLKYSHPLAVDELAHLYPDLNIVIAHYGSPWIVDATAVAAKNKKVHIDLSGLVEGEFNPDEFYAKNHAYYNYLKMWMEYLGDYDKFLFGTDWPLVNPAAYIDLIRKIIPESEQEKVFFRNSVRVFGLDKYINM